MSPDIPHRPLQTEQDRQLIAQSKDCVERSRQLLIETEPLLDPHRPRPQPRQRLKADQISN